MKKLLMSILIVFYCFLLFSQTSVLVDLIHGVDYYTDGWGEYDIQFDNAFQNYNISYIEKSNIMMDVEIINEIQMGDQQLVYDIDLPTQEELGSVKALYAFANIESNNDFSYVTGILINPQGEIVSEIFNGLLHYDDAYDPGWQIELNLSENVEYQIIIGYGDVLLDNELASGQFNLNDYDCVIRVVDETFSAFNGMSENYSEFDLLAFSEAFEDTLGFLNVYNLQDVYWLKPFVHFDVTSRINIDFEVSFPGNKTLAKPDPIIKKGNLQWNNFSAKTKEKNEIIYEAAFDSRLNFIHFNINGNSINLQNQVPYILDNIFIFKYVGSNKYILSELKILNAKSNKNINISKEYTTLELRDYIKNKFFNNAIENGLKNEEADHLVNDFIWIESLLKRARNHPSDYFGFYHFNGELYDKLAPYNCNPKPEKVERNAWVMLSNIKNRSKESVINFPDAIKNNHSNPIATGFVLREYGVVDEHYTRTINAREDLFNVELDEYLEYEIYNGQPQFYNNQTADLLSQFIEPSIYVDNGEYSFIVNNPNENGILNLGNILQPTVVLSLVGESGKVLSFGSAGFFANEMNCQQFSNNCANYLTGNAITQVSIDNTTIATINNALLFNVPNPFNPTTTISFIVQNKSYVEISIYNIKGQKIKTIVKSRFNAGLHSAIWNGNDESNKSVSSGIYYYKLNVNGKTEEVKKCLLLK